MPGFDGTGPRGQGPMTGGGRGYCAMPVGAVGEQFERGSYRGRGRGRRNCFYATGLPGWMRSQGSMRSFGAFSQDELSALKIQEEYLKKELDALMSRVKELESK